MKSPLTGTSNCEVIGTEDVAQIIDGYKKRLAIDVSKVFEGIEKVKLCKCRDTGLNFYDTGRELDNELFYTQLSQFPWYYSDERWEFDETEKLIKPCMHVLEIGCGKGVFVKRALAVTDRVLGLELNQHAVETAQADHLPVKKLLVQELGTEYDSSFDLICTFQVVEHLMNLQEFFFHAIRVLKPGGLLVMTVPNNESVLFYRTPIEMNEEQRFLFNLMNKPPHHFLCWDKHSIKGLAKVFPLEMVSLQNDLLPDYLLNLATEVWFYKIKKVIPKRFIRPFIKRFYHQLKGHSLMAVYKKV